MDDQFLFAETSQLKEFQCSICLKYFSRKFTLDMHLLIHKGVKPHQCPFCGKCFRQKGTLMRHKALHSTNNLFHCSLCNRGFRQKNVFLHHLKHRHNVSTETLDRRKYRTELKDYQSIMDTLPSFVHADSTAIASSEKQLDAKLLESLNNICDSSVPETYLDTFQEEHSDQRELSCTEVTFPTGNEVEGIEGDSDSSKLIYKCGLCLKMFSDYFKYQQHIEEQHDNVDMLLDSKPIVCPFPSVSSNEISGSTQMSCINVTSKVIDSSCCTKNDTPSTGPCNVSCSGSTENINLCIPCQTSFSSENEFKCHVKTHVQSVLGGDLSSGAGAKNTSDSLNLYSSNSNCEVLHHIEPCTDTVNHTHLSDSVNVCVPKKLTLDLQNDDSLCDVSLNNENSSALSDSKVKELLREREKSTKNDSCTKQKEIPTNVCTKIQTSTHPTFLKPMLTFSHHMTYRCNLCNRVFDEKVEFEYHRQLHLSTQSFICGYCKKRFSNKQLLLSHTRSVHMRIFRCSSCSRVFNYRRLYQYHIKQCSDRNSKKRHSKRCINVPLVDIQKLINSDNASGVLGVIPICDKSFSKTSDFKMGIPVISLDSLKGVSNLPFLNSSFRINGVLK